MSEGVKFGDDVLLDDLENAFPEVKTEVKPEGINPSTIVLEGDHIPEKYRGKSLEALIAANEALELAARSGVTPKTVERQQPTYTPSGEEPVYDRNAIAGLMEEGKTIEAMEAMMGYAYKRVQREFESRLAPLANTAGSIAEQTARERYRDEFELFGNEINEHANAAGAAMSQPGAWDNLISFVRGKQANLDKLIDHRGKKRSREAEGQDIMPNFSTNTRSTSATSRGGGGKPSRDELASDPDVQKVLRASGLTLDEYIRWYN